MIRYVNIGIILSQFIWISVTWGQLNFFVEEEQESGTFVGTVDGINGDYRLTDTPYFELNNGNILTKQKIDRESLPNDVIRTTAVSDDPSKVPIEISVTIIDINDHDPRFPVTSLTLNLTEGSSTAQHILPLADDGDSGKNADILSYEIISGDTDVFQLSFDPTTDGSVLVLKVLKSLNRENVDRYQLNISAEDGGDEPRRGYLRVVVNVQDINDNGPAFANKEYKRKQSEDTPVGSALFTIYANDSDTGENGRISYEIIKQSVAGTFEINSTTGQISLQKTLDYETVKTHSLEVTATDGGSPSMADNAFITIDVTNVNDNDPEIFFSYELSSASIASIDERVDIGSLVAIVSVSDADEPEIKNAVAMDIVSGNELDHFELIKLRVPNLARIQVANNISIGDQSSYNLTIRANDPEQESERFALASMTILVNSGENSPPKFEHAVYKITISEIAPAGSIVTNVRAVDADAGLNGRLVYSINAGNDLLWFEINKSTGLVTTTKRLHFEQLKSTNGIITLQVTVKDETATPLEDRTQIEITIIDENDNYPIFTENQYKFEIVETTIGEIGRVEATDKDFGKNGDITYNLKNTKVISEWQRTLSNSESPFTIDKKSGKITCVEKLNREDIVSYILRISASDSGTAPLTSYVDVTVDVLDANDNVPIFYPANYYVNVKSNTSPGTNIVTVKATDLDILDEGHLTYHFADNKGSMAPYYIIDAKTGTIKLSRSMMGRDGLKDIIMLFAIDADNEASSVNATVSIVVTSSDPLNTFEHSEYTFFVLENALNSYSIGKFESLSDNSKLYISDGNKDGLFQLNSVSGALTVGNHALLDAEKMPMYNLTITAEITDGSPSKSAGYITTFCLIYIIDVNDNYPIFSSLSSTAKEVEEIRFSDNVTVELGDEFISVSIYNAEAIDSDIYAENSNVTYSLSSSYPNVWIDVTTGLVTLKPLMTSSSFCNKDNFNFVAEIMACDQGSPQYCAALELNVTLILLDELYKKPLPNIFVTLLENTPVNYQISQYNFFSTRDAVVTYTIDNSHFQLFPDGEILLVKDLNFETAHGLETTVQRVIAHSEYSLQQTSHMSLTVIDVNDNPPKALQREYKFTLPENAESGYYIGTVLAADADSGIRSSLVYRIQNENIDQNELSITDYFYCERLTGRLLVSETFDRKILKALNLKSGEISLQIEILDQGGFNVSNSFVKTTTVPVKISVQFENRYPLRFASQFYFADVMENYNISNVLQVSTTDDDSMWEAKDVHYQIYDAISQNTDIPFTVTRNGIVLLKQGVGTLDREEREFYHLTLEANYDDSTENAFADAFVRILDVKDAPPVFTNASFNFAISESSPIMSVVGRVEANDGDIATEDTRIVYSLAPQIDDFGIDPTTGYIFLKNKIDYEIKQEYNFTVTAMDENNQPASTYVVISVIDENDNNPQFTSKSARTVTEGFYSVPIEIATVKATDKDSGSFGSVRYSVLDQTTTGRSSLSSSPTIFVDPITGKVTVSGMVDRETTPQLKITIRASDAEMTSRRFTDTSLTIDVTDSNDNSPKFTIPSSYVLSPKFSAQVGYRILKISAIDKDVGDNGEVTVSISTSDDIFAIDNDGYLVVASSIPSEPLVHSVELIATDKGSPPKQTKMIFNIIIVDESQNKARSLEENSEIEISENSRTGSYITTINTARARNSNMRYYMTGTTVNGVEDYRVFDIDNTSGDISQHEELSGKGGKVFQLDVLAVEETTTNTNPRLARKKVSISIKDENDHVPVFPKPSQHLTVSESIAPRSSITTVAATDDDVDDDVTYYIEGASDFYINSKTAKITVGVNGLDRERTENYNLKIIADDGLHRSSTELVLKVDDVNDSSPRFSSTTICFDIFENSPSGTVVGRLLATDDDLDSSTTYSIINDPYSKLFAINETMGIFSFEGSNLDRESKDLYVLDVRATDEGGLFSDVRLFIYVIDVNDNSPEFTSTGNDVIEISESINTDSLIETFIAKDVDIGSNGEVFYEIVSGDPDEYFRIDSSSGEIRTRLELDNEHRESFNITVMAWNKYAWKSDQEIAYKSLIVNIIDENDNSPNLVVPPVIYLNEDAQPNDIVFPVRFLDLDMSNIGDNQVALIQQSPDHGIFRRDAGNIVVNNVGRLDFESTEEYNLTFLVYDKDVPEFSNTANVIVRIVDVNEHAPVFDRVKYNTKLIENSALGSFVIKVHANDADSGYNGDVQYNLFPSANSSYFYIDQFSGDIFVANFVDFESTSELSFEVQAFDDGANQLSSTVSVMVEIQDENDCSPVIEPTYAIVHIKENAFDRTKSLLKFSATDSDSGDFGTVDIRSSITVSKPNTDAFSLTFNADGTRDLILTKPLDREMSSQYELTITAADRGLPPPIKSTATVLVIVDDVNDEQPEFEQYQYHATISEASAPGTLITNVVATDGDGSRITYTMAKESESPPFYINPTSGEVFTRDTLDREHVEFYNMTILATDERDMDGVQNTVSVFLFVTIGDVNDNAPAFESKEIVTYVNPSTSIGTVVVLEAFDPDSGENGRINYRMDENSKFAIDSDTGELSALEKLTSVNMLKIYATDQSTDRQSTSVDVTVYLTDVTENKPTMTHDVTNPIVITESIGTNSLLGTFEATSTRRNAGNIKFYLKGDRYSWFSLNEDSGRLTTNGGIDREISSKVTLWIEAKDSATPPLSTFENIEVEVKDVDDNAPLFEFDSYVERVREDETKTILKVSAFDPDEGDNGEVSYSIVNKLSENPEIFIIDSTTGNIRNVETLDREIKPSYKLVIRATDSGSPSLYRDVIVNVIVDDVNDNQQKFTKIFSATIKEDADVGDYVLQVTSTDIDLVSNHTYALTDNTGGFFSIDSDGIITVAKKLDREDKETHILEVQSSDDGWSLHTSVTIIVEDVNDNAPEFWSSRREASVSIDSGIGTIVMSLNATDEDKSYNGKVSYRIVGGNRYFSVNQIGEVITTRELSWNRMPNGCPTQQSFSVLACDSGIPNSLCSSCSVKINTKSVNLNTPKFNETNVKLALRRSTTLGTKLYSPMATDEDPGTVLKYHIQDGSASSYFSIDSDNNIVLNKTLSSFNVGQKLQITVQATDDGIPAKSTTMEISFEITSQNFHGPIFIKSSYTSTSVPENAFVGRDVIQIQADDTDTGINGVVVYEITEGNSEGKFAIGKTSGMIELISKLDYETTKQYDIVVTASDSAVKKLTATVNVRISIGDVNDNPPYFNSTYFEIRVRESIKTGQTITSVTAKDDDTGQNALVTYYLDDVSVFGVRSLTGDVYLNTELDLESQNIYTVKIIAENQGSDKASEAELRISVLGDNEFSPVFSQTSYEFNLPFSSEPGTMLGYVNATDEDSRSDGIVEYSMLPSQRNNIRVDKYSGTVLVEDSSAYLVGDVINFTIIAKNPTSSSDACLYDEASLKISVISNECNETYCKNGGTCSDGRTSVHCSCLPGYTGKHCEVNINECAGNPCNHGSCLDEINRYTCNCIVGYTGKDCDVIIDYCENQPCLNAGNCTSNPTSFTCSCTFGSTGPTCNIQSINFPAQSYMIVNGFGNEVSFEFSTVATTSLLLYSPLNNSPYLVLEIVDGKLQLKLKQSETGSPTKMRLDKVVNDGTWHTISISIQESTITLFLDDCSSTIANDCIATSQLDEEIDFSTTTLTIGGIRDVDDLKMRLLSSHDFVGCIRSLTIDSTGVKSSEPSDIIEKHLISDGCQRSESTSTCSTNICQNDGQCTDLWSDVQCTCDGEWTGERCGTEKTGQTLTGDGFATITFTESYVRDALLASYSGPLPFRRKRRTVGEAISSFEIRFRTREENAIVVAVVEHDEIYFGALFMLDGKLHYRHQTTNGYIDFSATDDVISDGNWHDVKVEIKDVDDAAADVTFTVDSSSEVKSFGEGFGLNVIYDFTNPIIVKNIFIGGLPDTSSITIPSVESFKGCVYHFKLDGVTYPLNPEVPNYAISLTVNGGEIASGCDGAGLTCDDVTCENGKTCVPDDVSISKCVCNEGYIDSEGKCALVSSAGLDWWIILLIVLLSILIVGGILIFVVCYRRKYGRKAVNTKTKVGNGNPSYEFQTRINQGTPDIVPNDVTIYDAADDNKEELATELTIVNSSSISNGTSISRENIISEIDKKPNLNGFRRQQFGSQTTNGRQSVTEPMNYVVPRVTQKRPASAQANLALPSETSVISSQPTMKQNKFHINQTRTLPRKIPNGSMEYLMGNKQSTPAKKSYRNTSSLSSAPRSYRERKRQRRSDTLEGLMRELSDVVGLTNEEWDLLHAGARALGGTPGELLYRDGSSVSTSSLTDMSVHSRTTSSSVRVRSFVRSTSPHKEVPVEDFIPGVVLNDSRKNLPLSSSKHGKLGDSFETLAVLGPFEFPPLPSESDTTETTTSPSDDDGWESTSNSTAASTIRKVDSPANSSKDGSNKSGQLDLNFPTNLEEYFTSLVDVFDDISGLKSDEIHSDERPHERRPSVMPSFVGHEISLWSEIEALSKRPVKRHTNKTGVSENIYQSSNSGRGSGRVTPAGRKSKDNSRVSSPANVILENPNGRDSRNSQRSRKTSDERIESERKERRRRRSGSGSSTNKSAHLKAEFVKYV